MNSANIGLRIENAIKRIEKLEDDANGFDASYGNIPIEIKGCLMEHKNGVDYKGKDRTTKGRFWIDNEAHRMLFYNKGFYIFAVYYMTDVAPIILKYRYMTALKVDDLIKSGNNTKIPYNMIFPNFNGGGDL